MFELMELATCRYRKIKSPYIYLHINPNESATNTSPQPFWTERGFDPVNETLVITPLTATEDANPILRNQQALNALAQAGVKTLEQAEVLAGLKELREHFSINPKDGLQTDNDKGMVIYCRRHECMFVHALTDVARDAILAEVARKAQEAQAVGEKPPEGEYKPSDNDETERKAAAKQARNAAQAEEKQQQDKHDLEEAAAAATANEQKGARAAALKKYNKATADAKTAQTALATAHAACTKTSKDVALVKTKIKVSGRVKMNADKAHKAVVVQQDLLVKGVANAKSKLTAAGKRKAGKMAMEKLTTAASIAKADHQAYQRKVTSSERSKRVAPASLTKFQKALVPFSEAAAEATRDEQLARVQLETAMAVHDVSREAMKALGIKVRPPTNLPTQTHPDAIQPPLSPTTKPKMERKNNGWYQMIGTEKESARFYKNDLANKEALPVGAVIQNAIKYY
jgi:hypothetical protein